MTGPRVDRRRLMGAGLVLAVVLSVPIAARRDGQRIAGTATTARTVQVPAVGDCVAALVGPVAPGSAESVAVVDASAVVFGRCAGTHAGEVAAFRRDPAGADPAGADPTARTGAAVAWCGEVAESYRVHLRWQVSAAAGAWAPVDAQRFLAVVGASDPSGAGDLSGGSGASRAGGWAVCAVLAPGYEQYRGSYLDSMADRAAPAPFGFCRSTDAPDQRVSCRDPHDEQVFGTARAGTTPTPDSCRDLVERLTAMPDPTGDGRLTVGVDGSGGGACRVRTVGPQRLTATLLGRGDAPLPLSPG